MSREQKIRDERLCMAIKVMRQPEAKIGSQLVQSKVLGGHYHFSMSFFGEVDAYGADGIVCGTSACFAGTIGLHPWFRRRGFKAEWDGNLFCNELIPVGMTRDSGNWDKAVADFFKISQREARGVIYKTTASKDRVVQMLRDLRDAYRKGWGDLV